MPAHAASSASASSASKHGTPSHGVKKAKDKLPKPEQAKSDKQGKSVVSDSTAERCTLEALRLGVPKKEVAKWIIDLDRDFYVKDDDTFEAAFFRKCDVFMRKAARRELKEKRKDSDLRLEAQSIDELEDLVRPRKLARKDQASWYAAAELAREDVAKGFCASYDQSLAIRLVLACGGIAAHAFSELCRDSPHSKNVPRTGRSSQDGVMSLKQLALLIHPDKTAHPHAKDAFQRLLMSGWEQKPL